MLELFGERGGDPDRPGKRDPLDSLLWRDGARRRTVMADRARRGPSGLAHRMLGHRARTSSAMGFDVQGGGSDLVFPHHEHSAAHAEALTGTPPFAQHYVHAGMIGLDGEKMSKSRGNLVLVSKLRGAGVDPMAIRLALMDGHYRDYREWTGGRLPAAEARLRAVARRGRSRHRGAPPNAVLAEVRAALADDLDTTRAIAAIDAWAEQDGDDERAPALVRDLADALLGIAL